MPFAIPRTKLTCVFRLACCRFQYDLTRDTSLSLTTSAVTDTAARWPVHLAAGAPPPTELGSREGIVQIYDDIGALRL